MFFYVLLYIMNYRKSYILWCSLYFMFIRANKRKNKVYYYIVESIRKGSKVKQKVLLYLGTAEKVYLRLKLEK